MRKKEDTGTRGKYKKSHFLNQFDRKFIVEHGTIFVIFFIILFIAGTSGGFADKIGWELLNKWYGDDVHLADGIHSVWWDVGEYYLPAIDCVWLSDAIVFSQLFLGMFCILYKPKSLKNLVERLSTFCLIYGIILFLRTITIFSTVHSVSPVVAARLREGENVSMIKESIGYIANTNCFDMMFSGHASSDLTMALFAIYCLSAPFIVRALTIINGIFGCVALIMVGDHYTSDILVAVYTTILVFFSFITRVRKNFDPTYHSNQ